MLQNTLRCFDRHKPYRERPLKVNVIDQPQPQTSEISASLLAIPKHEEDLFKALSSLVNLIHQSYREQNKSVLTYLAENEHVQIDDKRNVVIIHSKS